MKSDGLREYGLTAMLADVFIRYAKDFGFWVGPDFDEIQTWVMNLK